jgi:hypothetical protein
MKNAECFSTRDDATRVGRTHGPYKGIKMARIGTEDL